MIAIHCYKCNQVIKIELANLLHVGEIQCPQCKEKFPNTALLGLQKMSSGYREAVDALVLRGWARTLSKGWGISVSGEDLRPTRGVRLTSKKTSPYWGQDKTRY